MGGIQKHLGEDLLSAFSDGETNKAESDLARAHLAACATCASRLGEFRRLDAVLTADATLPCEAVWPLLSAELDRELDPDVAPVLRQHLAACGDCRTLGASWETVEEAIRDLPSGRPSVRVDAAIERLARPRRLAWPSPGTVGTSVVRLAAGAVVLVAILTTSVLLPAPSDQTAALRSNGALVASAQTVVLDARTNSLYVLRPAAGLVIVRDATTEEQLGQISVGGTPTALALDESRGSVYVLDSASKSIVRIDTTTRSVVGSSPLTLAGAPVSLQASGGKLLVASSGDASSGSQIAVVDTSTSALRVEAVKAIDVAPTLVVVDPTADRTFVLAKDATLVLDTTSLARVATLPGGGVGAASDGQGVTAILAAANGRARVSFYGVSAAGLDLPGAPLAIAAGADRSFAALIDSGNGRRVVQFDTSGILRSRDLPANGAQVAYDVSGDRFVVVAATGDVVAYLSSALSVTSPSPTPTRQVPTSSPASSPSATPSGTPAASALPAAQPSLAPPVAAAREVWTSAFYLELTQWHPERLVSLGDSAWFSDKGTIVTLDLLSGDATKLAQLPKGESVSYLAVGTGLLYVIGDRSADLHLIDLTTGKLDTIALPYGAITGLATTPDGHAWVSSASTGSLIEFVPATRQFRLVQTPIARSLSAISSDTGGRVWYAYRSDAGARVGSYDRFARQVLEYDVPGLLAVDNVFADRTGTVWLSSPEGRWVAVRGGAVVASLAGAAVDVQRFALGPGGVAWLLRTSAAGTRLGSAGAPLDTSLPAGVRDLAVDGRGMVWAADTLQGGFYILANSVTSP